MKAQALRELANVIGNEAKFAQSSGSKTIMRLCKNSIKKEVTDLQNLVRQMADQLEQERAEVERMKRLYAMARKEASHFEDIVKRAEAQAKAAFA